MGEVQVKLAGDNLFVFQFVNATARDWVLENGPWHVQNNPMILQKWEPDLSSTWIALHCQCFGEPPVHGWRRPSYANVCIEIAPDFQIPRIIHVILRNGTVALC
ncbi:hypothetical protein V6N13_000123 [Hibiscus sabdariffa]